MADRVVNKSTAIALIAGALLGAGIAPGMEKIILEAPFIGRDLWPGIVDPDS